MSSFKLKRVTYELISGNSQSLIEQFFTPKYISVQQNSKSPIAEKFVTPTTTYYKNNTDANFTLTLDGLKSSTGISGRKIGSMVWGDVLDSKGNLIDGIGDANTNFYETSDYHVAYISNNGLDLELSIQGLQCEDEKITANVRFFVRGHTLLYETSIYAVKCEVQIIPDIIELEPYPNINSTQFESQKLFTNLAYSIKLLYVLKTKGSLTQDAETVVRLQVYHPSRLRKLPKSYLENLHLYDDQNQEITKSVNTEDYSDADGSYWYVDFVVTSSKVNCTTLRMTLGHYKLTLESTQVWDLYDFWRVPFWWEYEKWDIIETQQGIVKGQPAIYDVTCTTNRFNIVRDNWLGIFTMESSDLNVTWDNITCSSNSDAIIIHGTLNVQSTNQIDAVKSKIGFTASATNGRGKAANSVYTVTTWLQIEFNFQESTVQFVIDGFDFNPSLNQKYTEELESILQETHPDLGEYVPVTYNTVIATSGDQIYVPTKEEIFSNNITPKYFTFNGWKYKDVIYTINFSVPANDVTLIAQLIPKIYNITYKLPNYITSGVNEFRLYDYVFTSYKQATDQKSAGLTIRAKDSELNRFFGPTRLPDAFIFQGWKDTSTGNIYTDNEIITNDLLRDITLEAVFSTNAEEDPDPEYITQIAVGDRVYSVIDSVMRKELMRNKASNGKPIVAKDADSEYFKVVVSPSEEVSMHFQDQLPTMNVITYGDTSYNLYDQDTYNMFLSNQESNLNWDTQTDDDNTKIILNL